MLNWLSGFIDSLAPSTTQRSETSLHQLSLVLVGIVFVLGTTLIVAFDTLFPTQQDTAALRIGSVSANDIRAPYTLQYESDVLTVQQRDAAATVITPIYNPPDPTIARQQVTLLQRIIEFVDNIRRDPFGTLGAVAPSLLMDGRVQIDLVLRELAGVARPDNEFFHYLKVRAVRLERRIQETETFSDLGCVRPLVTFRAVAFRAAPKKVAEARAQPTKAFLRSKVLDLEPAKLATLRNL